MEKRKGENDNLQSRRHNHRDFSDTSLSQKLKTLQYLTVTSEFLTLNRYQLCFPFQKYYFFHSLFLSTASQLFEDRNRTVKRNIGGQIMSKGKRKGEDEETMNNQSRRRNHKEVFQIPFQVGTSRVGTPDNQRDRFTTLGLTVCSVSQTSFYCSFYMCLPCLPLHPGPRSIENGKSLFQKGKQRDLWTMEERKKWSEDERSGTVSPTITKDRYTGPFDITGSHPRSPHLQNGRFFFRPTLLEGDQIRHDDTCVKQGTRVGPITVKRHTVLSKGPTDSFL